MSVKRTRSVANGNRNALAEKLFRSGAPATQIGCRLQLSRERVRQILAERGVTATDGGRTLRSRRREALREALRESKMDAAQKRRARTYGCTQESFRHVLDSHPEAVRAWRMHRYNCKRNGVEFRLALDHWLSVWLSSGHWNERGRGGDNYVMGRINKRIGYVLGNVVIVRKREIWQTGKMR